MKNPSLRTFAVAASAIAVLLAVPTAGRCDSAADAKAVAALDTEYQAAVERNDAAGMDRILADDFVLVTGIGKTFNKADLLAAARNKEIIYERQVEIDGTQKVRVWGDTAVVTALLWVKGTRKGQGPFDFKLWFSDTYVRTPAGWKYVFGQAAQRLAEGS
jgi:ketosteroid isomerase-like protein